MPHHRFAVKSSFGQYLALMVLAAVCLLSFCFWPDLDYLFYQPLRWLMVTTLIGYFSVRLWRLRYWQLEFWLAGNGGGQFETGDSFDVAEPVMVTPWLVSFSCQLPTGFRRLYLFSDMFDDTDYRHLCRLLLNRNSPYSG